MTKKEDKTYKSENMAPKVSVILSSFNHEKYICEAIDSILNQLFTDFELIIMDDCSPDNSWKLIKAYTDPRIRAFRTEENIGGVLQVNKAIFELAAGEYIAIHHSDDVWESEKLQKQVDFLESEREVAAVFTWTSVIDDDSCDLDKDWYFAKPKTRWEWLNDLFFMRNPFAHPSILIRKSIYEQLGGYRPYLGQITDVEMYIRVLLNHPVTVLQEVLTKHRQLKNESNQSAARPDVGIRTWHEWNIARENYLSLAGFDQVVAIFPDLERFRNPRGFDIKFLLSMECLYGTEQKNAWQLGLKWLWELRMDGNKYAKVRDLYSFSDKEFYNILGKFDVYSLYLSDYFVELERGKAWLESQWKAYQLEVAAKDAELAAKDAELAAKDAELAAKDAELAAKDAELAAKDAELAAKDAELCSRDVQLTRQSVELEYLNSSFPVRVLKKVGLLSND